MRTNIFERLSFLSVFLVIILLPLFFLPWSNISVETSKGLLLVIGLAVSIISWGLARFFDGTITFPRSHMLVAGAGIVLAFLLSALFLKSRQVSLFGTIFDMGTFWFMFAGFMLMLMSSIIFRDQKKAKIVLFGAILSGAVVMVFQILHLFAPDFLSLGVLSGKTGNLVGSWNALGIFAGLSALTSLLVVEFFSTTKIEKLVLQILAVISMVVIAAVNFPLVWELLGISALIIFVYKVTLTSKEKSAAAPDTAAPAQKVNFPVFSFAIILISLLFFMSGNFIGGALPEKLGVDNNEISPSLRATMGVTGSVLKENPIFGIGPNKWSAAWAMYKPLNINGTPFWDVSFSSGSGLLPTFAATTGIFGILALLAFFVLFILNGVRSIFSSIRHGANWETMAFFVLSFYLFVASFFYSSGAVLFLLALAFAGAFIGLSSSISPRGEISISYLNDHRRSFFSILFLVLVLIATAAASFTYLERLVSVSYFSKAVTATAIPEAEAAINRAIALHQNDLYFRTYAQIYLLKLDSLVSQDQKSTPTDEDKALLQANLDQAVRGAQAAVTYDDSNYLNYLTLASVFQRLTAYGVQDAYEKAVEAFMKASALNPNNPGIKLAMSTASINAKKPEEAQKYANEALTLKADYIDAYIVLSQIAKNEGKNALALEYAQKALAIAPANAELIKYVDSLKGGNSGASKQ